MTKKNPLTEEQLKEAQRLKQIYKLKAPLLGITQGAIADRLDTSQGAVSHYLNAVNALNLKAAQIFAEMLKVSIAEFSPRLERERRSLSAQLGVAETKPAYGNVSDLYRAPQMVPLISWVQAGAWCEAPDNYAPGDAEEWLSCPSRHSERTYALKVVGDSMTSAIPGEKSYPHGTIIFVDPERAVEVGSRIIARLPNSSEVTFKVYTLDAGVPYLMPINTRYPAIPMPESTHICGVVIGSYWPE